MAEKRCTQCGVEKSTEDFGLNIQSKDGLKGMCKTCRKEQDAAARRAKGAAPRRVLDPNATSKVCTQCKEDKPVSEYHPDKRSKDKLYPHCKACHYKMTHAYETSEKGKIAVSASKRKQYYEGGRKLYYRNQNATPEAKARRIEYAKSAAGKATQKRKDAIRKEKYPERLQAKTAVGNAVQAGRLPAASTQKCALCGAQATEYHHISYAEEHWLHVTPLCKRCHATTYTNPV